LGRAFRPLERLFGYQRIPVAIPPRKVARKTPSTVKIISAGMAATDHFTIKVTIDQDGIRTSTTIISLFS
jgi:hypothetical protein